MMFREFFYLHKSDRKVLISLLLVAVVALLVAEYFGEEPPVDAGTVSQLHAEDSAGNVMSLQKHVAEVAEAVTDHEGGVGPSRFPFDPNTADSTQLLQLGLRPWQVRAIYKYRAAGGIFRSKQDFARLYGLTVKEYRELEPYIRISADYRPASTLVASDKAVPPRDTLRFPVKLQAGQTIDLATADTNQLRRVPGIGSYYARRIVDYGRRLGGYASTNQLQEIDGFPATALPYITLSTVAVSKLQVNSLSLDELRRHPYVNYYQARAIVDYRRQHGRITDLAELRLLPPFTEADIARLRPYVDY